MLGLKQPPVRETLMPEISRFFGVVITMFYSDHGPPRALALVIEWAARHRQGLLDNWALARDQADLRPIEPLT